MESGKVSVAERAAARWLTVHDELLRGITHALSNRIATIGASAYMLEHGDVPLEQSTQALRAETDRMELLLQQLRQLPARPNAEPEPMTVNDICASAVSVHRNHGELRDIECDIDVDADVYPIWAEPQSVLHALLVALSAAKRSAAPDSRVLLHAAGDANVVKIRISARQPALTDDSLNTIDAETAGWLLAANGGTARAIHDGCELELPTLLAIRKARKT